MAARSCHGGGAARFLLRGRHRLSEDRALGTSAGHKAVPALRPLAGAAPDRCCCTALPGQETVILAEKKLALPAAAHPLPKFARCR